MDFLLLLDSSVKTSSDIARILQRQRMAYLALIKTDSEFDWDVRTAPPNRSGALLKKGHRPPACLDQNSVMS